MPIQRIRIHIDLPPLAAARPRLYQGRIHMRSEDKDWRWMAGVRCKRAWGNRPPLKQVLVMRWEFYSATSPGDNDNLLKNALDMLKPAGLVLDDNVTRIPNLVSKWRRSDDEHCVLWFSWQSECNPEACSPGTQGPYDQKIWPKPPRKSRKKESKGQGTINL